MYYCADKEDCDLTPENQITLSGKDISWKSDREVKFKNPKPKDGQDLCQFWEEANAIKVSLMLKSYINLILFVCSLQIGQ